MLKTILLLTGVTLIPALELRASIPMAFFGMSDAISWPVAVVVCVVANILLGWLVFRVMGPVFTFAKKWRWFENRIWPVLEKTRHKLHP